MLTHIALLGLSLLVPASGTAARTTNVIRPRIEVWSNHGDAVYTRAQGVRVYFRADQDGYVTLFRVDTDGRVRVLFPRDPWEDNFVRAGREYEALGSNSRDAFFVDDYPGVGYLFAVVAADAFDYSAIESGNHWDYRTIADGRVRGDPYVALTDLAERIVPENYADWDYDITPYYVEQRYDYPRFLCYDCHAYASYTYWDPYWRSCVRFRIVVYDDPYYYPYRYYGGGRRVVFVRPFRPQPRFVFKDRDNSGRGGASRDNFVTRERVRPVNDDTRRTPTRRDPATTGTAGLVPAPRDGPRRERPITGQAQQRGSEVQPVRPDQPNRDDDRRRGTDEPARGNDKPARGNDSPARGTESPARGNDDNRGRPREAAPVREAPRDRGVERPPASRAEPRRSEPRVESPRPSRAEPRVESPRPSRAEPRVESPRPSRAEPRVESPRPSRAEPRAEPARPQRTEPRAEPRRESPARAEPRPQRSEPKQNAEPELRRRKPE